MPFKVEAFVKGGTSIEIAIENSIKKARRTAARAQRVGFEEDVTGPNPGDPEEVIFYPPGEIISINIVEQ